MPLGQVSLLGRWWEGIGRLYKLFYQPQKPPQNQMAFWRLAQVISSMMRIRFLYYVFCEYIHTAVLWFLCQHT